MSEVVTNDLCALAARVEKLTGPDREVDDAIAEAVLAAGGSVRSFEISYNEPSVRMFRYVNGSIGTSLQYTYSLDAAMTLVPEGWSASIKTLSSDTLRGGRGVVTLWQGPSIAETKRMMGEVLAGTPAIALTAAALRARAQQSGQEE